MRIAPLLAALLLTSLPAAAADPITLSQAMADPDWIGPPVEEAWWRWDGQAAQYVLKREGASIRDHWQVGIDGSAPVRVDGAALADIDGSDAVFDAAATRSAFVRNDDVFVRDLRSGALTQLTRTLEPESRPQWSRDGALVWRAGNAWYRWDGRVVAQAALVKAEDAPGKPPKADDLRDRQLRLIDTLRDDRARREAAREQDEAWRAADNTRAPAPTYLGKDIDIVDSAMSPDGRWLLVATTDKDAKTGTEGKLPKYVTESGYEEVEDVRTRVGRNDPLPQTLWLTETATGKVRELAFDDLPGIKDDPLATLRKAAGKDPLKGARAVQVATSGDNGNASTLRWSDDSHTAAVRIRAIDNKDRWIATVDLTNAALQPRHRLHDEAWINWGFNDFGWLADGRTLWYLSEESGYSHLYTSNGSTRIQLTDGRWETSAVQPARDGSAFWFLCNRAQPGDYEVCRVPAAGGEVREVTTLDGVESFSLSPDGSKLLLRHSSAYVPPQLAVVDASADAGQGGTTRELTDTRTAAYKARTWITPQIVQVPSTHGAGTIWGKYYAPATMEPGKKYPIVMFVHGAGYLQNVHLRYPAYFREQMFHNLLVQQGYIVLDLDYRASEGYGRDWRTAIYR
ncbi:MAG: DPP IV N-terminal domain-containing protein, partial [Thermomonas sp.]